MLYVGAAGKREHLVRVGSMRHEKFPVVLGDHADAGKLARQLDLEILHAPGLEAVDVALDRGQGGSVGGVVLTVRVDDEGERSGSNRRRNQRRGSRMHRDDEVEVLRATLEIPFRCGRVRVADLQGFAGNGGAHGVEQADGKGCGGESDHFHGMAHRL